MTNHRPVCGSCLYLSAGGRCQNARGPHYARVMKINDWCSKWVADVDKPKSQSGSAGDAGDRAADLGAIPRGGEGVG